MGEGLSGRERARGYCKRVYFRAAKFSRIKLYGAYLHVLISAHIPFNSICSIMMIIFTHIMHAFMALREWRENNIYVLRKNVYIYSMWDKRQGRDS